MEYVEGKHVDVHCREARLGVRAVLRLFLPACDAVAFAHRRLVVHCDLKPSNLLADGNGRPVLLDFGIAHLLDSVEAGAAAGGTAPKIVDLLAIEDALSQLERLDPRCGQVIHLICFGGLTREDIAGLLGISVPTVDRELRFARSWLNRVLRRRTAKT